MARFPRIYPHRDLSTARPSELRHTPQNGLTHTHGQNKRPRHKHDRSQSNFNPTNTPTSRPQNPSKIQVNVLFVLQISHRPITAN
nr:MAG TPA: hypothetical protein [Caudoviricetes sp.]